MKQTFTYKDIWKIAYPIILGSIAQNIINISDTAFLGHYGQTELAASALAGIYYFAFFMIGYGFATGAQIIIARRTGEQKPEEIGSIFENALYFLILFAFIMFFMLKFLSPLILKQAINSNSIYEKTTEFLDYRAYGFFFAFINICFGAFFIGTTKTGIILWSNLVMAAVNILFSYLLIFGNFGFNKMGIKGAAIANVIAEASATIFFILYTIFKVDRKKYLLFKFVRPSLQKLKVLLKISSPVMLQFIISLSAWLTFFIMVEKMGEEALAVSNIVKSIYIVLMIPIWGFGSATSSLVSNLLGQNKPEEVMKLVGKACVLCITLMFVPIILSFIFPEYAISVYTSDSNLILASLKPLIIVNIVLIPIAMAFILFHAVSGTGKTIASLIIEIIVIAVYLAFVYFMTNIVNTSIEYVWTCEFVYAAFLALLSFAYMKSGKWKSSKI